MIKMQTALVVVVLSLATLPGLIRAEPYIYEHDGEPLFSITFPEGWYVDSDYAAEAKAAGAYKGGKGLRILEAMPSDGTKLWFGIWVTPEAVVDLEKGLEYVASLDGDLFTNVEYSRPQDTSLGGMPAKTFHGLGRRLGEDIEFAVSIFEPRTEVITVALYVGRPQTWRKHQGKLEAVVDSIQPVDD